MTNKSAPFYGWRVVAAAFIVAVFGWGLGFYGPPVYLDTLVRTRVGRLRPFPVQLRSIS